MSALGLCVPVVRKRCSLTTAREERDHQTGLPNDGIRRGVLDISIVGEEVPRRQTNRGRRESEGGRDRRKGAGVGRFLKEAGMCGL